MLLSVALAAAVLSGCEGVVAQTEPWKLEEPLADEDLNRFLSIISHLPGQKLPPLPSALLEAPSWSSQRTLPVNELRLEELKRLDERFTIERFSQRLQTLRGLKRALKREGWSLEQFASVSLALAAAINRSVTDEAMLAIVLDRGRVPLADLEADTRVFSKLADDEAFVVLDRAAWIPLVHRAKWLSQIPPESVAIVVARREALRQIFARDLFKDPFASFSRLFHDAGMPFEELPETGSDDDLRSRE